MEENTKSSDDLEHEEIKVCEEIRTEPATINSSNEEPNKEEETTETSFYSRKYVPPVSLTRKYKWVMVITLFLVVASFFALFGSATYLIYHNTATNLTCIIDSL